MSTRTPHQLTEQVKLLQKAVLVHRGTVLLLQRDENSATRPQKWDLPGGNSEWPTEVEDKEGLHQEDIAREIKEETGITIASEHFKHSTMVSFNTTQIDQPYTILTGWVVEMPHDFDVSSVELSTEHTVFEWVPFDEAREYDFDFAKSFIVPMIRTVQDRFSN